MNSLSLVDSVLDPPVPENADWFVSEAPFHILMDGAGPKNNLEFRGFPNSAVWLVRQFASEFVRSLKREFPTFTHRLEYCREKLCDEYSAVMQLNGQKIDRALVPIACLIALQEHESFYELLNIGDSVSLIKYKSGEIEKFGWNQIALLDQKVLAELNRLKNSISLTHDQAVKRIWPSIEKNRMQANEMPGYDVISPCVSMFGRLERKMIEKSSVESILLMSDGYWRLIDTFGLLEPWQLFEGLTNNTTLLRKHESLDIHCDRTIRIKVSDDVSAMLLST
ncbi:MAG: hypothetical protein P8011_01520 [Acidihalobacter sp.]